MNGIAAAARKASVFAIKDISPEITIYLFGLFAQSGDSRAVRSHNPAFRIHKEYRIGKLIQETFQGFCLAWD